MNDFAIGVLGTLSAAAVIAVVTLAFKNQHAYIKLFKVMSAVIVALAIAYAGYAAGSEAGGKAAALQITGGTPPSEVSTLMPWWPIIALSIAFSVLVTLTWFPAYLGFQGPKQQEDKHPG